MLYKVALGAARIRAEPMEHDLDAIRLPYRGWEIRIHLTSVSIEGTVAAGAVLFAGGNCKCYIVSCKQFANGSDALRAIEQKAARWIDDREASSETSAVLRQVDVHEAHGKGVAQPDSARRGHREAQASAGAGQRLAAG